MLSDEAIGAILTHDREGPAEALVEAALAAGGADNVTVVVIETS
jgi:serine/threonine protein phosphatase PrpC